MAELELDAFVAPTSNQPAPKLGAPRGLGRHKRPDVWSFLGSQVAAENKSLLLSSFPSATLHRALKVLS